MALAGGTAAVVAMLGISQAAADRIVERLQTYEATSISVSLPGSAWTFSEDELTDRAAAIEAVDHVGTIFVPTGEDRGVLLESPLSGNRTDVGLAVATPQGLATRGATVNQGAVPVAEVLEKDPFLVMLGSAVANDLGVSTRIGENRILINGRSATVAAIIEDGGQNSALTASLVVAPETAEVLGALPSTRRLEIIVDPSASEAVARVIGAALLPSSPDDVGVVVPPSPQQLREQLTSDTRGLVLAVTAVTLVATSFGIITTMQISVWERRGEIGLTRALGMTRKHVARVFLIECIVLAIVGSAIGWGAGVLINSWVLFLNGWRMTLPFEVLGLPALGVLVGAISGLIPARNAARVDPAELLRG